MKSQDSNGKQNDKQVDQELFALAYDDGRWFKFPKALLRADLDYGPLIMLAFLISQHFRFEANAKNRNKNYNGWFFCRTTTIEKELAMTRNSQAKFLQKLVAEGLITTERRGMPPKRWIHLNLDRVIQLCMVS